MKNIVLCALLISLNAYGQKEEVMVQLPKNEIKLNTISLIVLGAIDFSYERISNEESSYGVSIYLNATDYDEYQDNNIYGTFSVTPYYRVHFSKKYNQGFFVETFASFYKGEEYIYESGNDESGYYFGAYSDTPTPYNGIALGVGIGGKWVTKRGFVAEISLGIGRTVYNGPDDIPVVVRGGITLGKRF